MICWDVKNLKQFFKIENMLRRVGSIVSVHVDTTLIRLQHVVEQIQLIIRSLYIQFTSCVDAISSSCSVVFYNVVLANNFTIQFYLYLDLLFVVLFCSRLSSVKC